MTLIADLARETGLSVKAVRRLIATAPKRYKTFPIPKRDGSERIIAQPAFEIKALQRVAISRYLSKLPVHDSAYAYVKGKSIRSNALRHVHSSYILKLDFKNFFYSIRPADLERVLLQRPVDGLPRLDFTDLYNLLFWGAGGFAARCLSIGAPSSPMVSNIVMYEFDKRASEIAAELKLTYTRYADDITVSSSNGQSALLRFEREIASLIRSQSLMLDFNERKRGMYGRGDRRMVTGLILTPTGQVSIGRDRKRKIRASLHQILVGDADDRLLMYCKGMLAFVIAAEPSFMKSLYGTYGADFIRGILRAPQISFYAEELMAGTE